MNGHSTDGRGHPGARPVRGLKRAMHNLSIVEARGEAAVRQVVVANFAPDRGMIADDPVCAVPCMAAALPMASISFAAVADECMPTPIAVGPVSLKSNAPSVSSMSRNGILFRFVLGSIVATQPVVREKAPENVTVHSVLLVDAPDVLPASTPVYVPPGHTAAVAEATVRIRRRRRRTSPCCRCRRHRRAYNLCPESHPPSSGSRYSRKWPRYRPKLPAPRFESSVMARRGDQHSS